MDPLHILILYVLTVSAGAHCHELLLGSADTRSHCTAHTGPPQRNMPNEQTSQPVKPFVLFLLLFPRLVSPLLPSSHVPPVVSSFYLFVCLGSNPYV